MSPAPPSTSPADEIAALQQRVQQLEAELSQARRSTAIPNGTSSHDPEPAPPKPPPPAASNDQPTLEPEEYKRYGRQLIMPEIGLPGQLRLKRSKVLIVGCGGLGCPAAFYLAGAGVGTLGLIDDDTVEASNLHRQILHSTSRVGVPKVDSAVHALQDLNPHVTYIPHRFALSASNALSILRGYDLVLDCTDHPSLRYLISDAAVVLGKPVVSASALRSDGQLVVLNAPPGAGPCYRCVWPRPPPAASMTSCGEGGVLGPVVGAMGVLQALEAVKLLLKPPREEVPARMTLFAGMAETMWRSVRMRGKRKDCVACGDAEHRTVTAESITGGGTDYVAFCGGGAVESGALRPEERVQVEQVRAREKPVLVDVRDPTQFGICRVPGSVNIPFSEFEAAARSRGAGASNAAGAGNGNDDGDDDDDADAAVLKPPLLPLPPEMEDVLRNAGEDAPVYILCRLGNDSQVAARMVRDAGRRNVFDVRGGVAEWARVAPQDGVVEY